MLCFSDEDDSQEDGDDDDDDGENDVEERRRIAASLPSAGSSAVDEDDDSLEEAEALAEFDFLVSESSGDDSRTDGQRAELLNFVLYCSVLAYSLTCVFTIDSISHPTFKSDSSLHVVCNIAGDGSEWARNTDWPMDQQQLSKQIEQYKRERQKKHDNSQRPRKHDLKAMIATLGGGEDEEVDDSEGISLSVEKKLPCVYRHMHRPVSQRRKTILQTADCQLVGP